MPFKNLQRDAALAWLEVGVVETMVSDLKRSGVVEVVERGQIDRAMAEISLAGATDLYAPSEAAKIGRMVGARTIVVGAFQRAGKSLRITARFVEVETGIVKGSAKATGKLKDVFDLQDSIVDELVTGKKRSKRRKPLKRRPKRKKTKRSLEAYKIYSLSLETSDAKRLGMLREALALDPELSYAKDDLAALERRLKGLDKDARGAQQALGEVTLARVVDKALKPDQRSALARAHLDALERNRRYRTLAADAPRIYALDLPVSADFDPAERAAYGVALANARLRKLDLALQAAEKYLKAFPAGTHYREVEEMVREIVDDRRSLKDRQASFDEDIVEPRAGAAALKNAGVRRGDPAWENLDWDECIISKWARLPDAMIEHCGDYLKRWRKRAKDDEDIAERLPTANAWLVWSHGRRGEFKTALKLAERTRERYPRALATNQMGDGHRVHSIERFWMQTWPTDVEDGR